MSDSLRVVLEVGSRRWVAGAIDWPGLDRAGTSQVDALQALASYRPRYAGVADRAGQGSAFARQRDAEVVERVPGTTATDVWNVAHVPSRTEGAVLSAVDLERLLDLLVACWAQFDDVAARVSARLATDGRRGRHRDAVVRHVYVTESRNWWSKVGLRAEEGVAVMPHELAAQRHRYLDAIRAHNAEGRPARSSPIRFLIRRTACHVMDHAWEMQDRDLAPRQEA
jgi:hypothetical protein